MTERHNHKTRRVLALDMAIKTGWCVMQDGNRIEASGVWDYTHARDKGRHNGHLFNEVYGDIDDAVTTYGVNLICYERAHHRGASTRITLGMASAALMAAASLNIEVFDVHTVTLKKFATGNYKAGKDDMKAFAKTLLGREPVDDNEADAVAVAVWAMANARSHFPSGRAR